MKIAYLFEKLKELEISPSKLKGQNYLIDENIAKKIVEYSAVKENELVLEIGCGLGMLTKYILEKKARVLAVDIEVSLKDYLAEQFKDCADKFTFNHINFLKLDFQSLLEPVKIIGNLPYSITNPIMQKLVDSKPYITGATVMIQKETADRFTALSCNKSYGIPTLFIENRYLVKKVFNVSNRCFYPAPKVESTVISMTPKEVDIVPEKLMAIFQKLVKTAFNQRRKKISNSLLPFLEKEEIEAVFSEAGIDQNKRAEQLSIIEYRSLAEKILKKKNEHTGN